MEKMNFPPDDQLIAFFRREKTKMSCIENPNMFLNQIRDHNLIPEVLYQEVIAMRDTNTMRSGVYKVLVGVEKMGGQSVKLFWRSVFQDHIQKCYPIFNTLQKELLDISFREKRPSAKQPSRNNEAERPGTMQIQEKVVTKREREKIDQEIDEAKPGTSLGSTQKKPAKKSSLLYKRETLTVTCNQKKGVLYPHKLATEDECILSETQWFSPPEFEAFSGKERSKNWKTSIRYRNIPLQTFIKDGRLKYKRNYRGRAQKRH